jgi:hypothetical protein
MSALGQKQTYAPQKTHVRFAPNSDRESGFPQTVMSALHPKADMALFDHLVAHESATSEKSPDQSESAMLASFTSKEK